MKPTEFLLNVAFVILEKVYSNNYKSFFSLLNCKLLSRYMTDVVGVEFRNFSPASNLNLNRSKIKYNTDFTHTSSTYKILVFIPDLLIKDDGTIIPKSNST